MGVQKSLADFSYKKTIGTWYCRKVFTVYICTIEGVMAHFFSEITELSGI